MADKKISQLPAATTPLAGTEVLPIVQSGTTDKVSVANLTAGRAISATQYTSTIATGTAPLVVASTTEVANLKAATATLADSATSANAVKSNATTGVLQVTGPAAASTRVMTTPDANFSAARIDAGQLFVGEQVISYGKLGISTTGSFSPTAALDINGGGVSVYSKISNGYNGNNYAFGLDSFNTVSFYASTSGGADLPYLFYGATKEYGRFTTSGNLAFPSGQGIDFSATASGTGTATSELLADYEEGTWTPNQGSGLTVVGAFSSSGTYTKIGRMVCITGQVQGATSVAVSNGGTICTNVPFTGSGNYIGSAIDGGTGLTGTQVLQQTNTVYSVAAIPATGIIMFTVTYFV